MTEKPNPPLSPSEIEREKTWYKVDVPAAHLAHPGRPERRAIYVLAENAVAAIEQARTLGGWKRDIGKHSFPNVRELRTDEVEELLRQIAVDKRVALEQVKKRGYHGDRP